MFESSYIPPWVGYQNGRWVGTPSNDLISPITGVPNPYDYPFKKYFLESDAPIYENRPDPSFFGNGPKNLEVNLKIAIQKGNLYDISSLERSRSKPILVVKLSDGTYNVITFNQNLILTEDDLEKYRIPIMINGLEMKQIDFNDQKSIDAATLKTTIRFDQDSFTLPALPETVNFNRGQIYLLIKKQANPNGTPINPENYSRILGAEIITFDQLIAKNVFDKLGGFWTIKEGAPYMKDKISINMLESYVHSSYIGVGSASQLLFGKGTKIDIADISPALLKKYNDDISGKNKYQQVFQFQASPYSFGQVNFNDHFFCRV
jgi:hypothetical protein